MRASVDYGEHAKKSKRTCATEPRNNKLSALNHVRPEQGIECVRKIGRGGGRVILTGC